MGGEKEKLGVAGVALSVMDELVHTTEHVEHVTARVSDRQRAGGCGQLTTTIIVAS